MSTQTPYIKELLPANKIARVQHVKFIKAYDDTYNPGQMTYLHIFKFNGQECKYYSTAEVHAYLMKMGQGGDVQIMAVPLGEGKVKMVWPDMDEHPQEVTPPPPQEQFVDEQPSPLSDSSREKLAYDFKLGLAGIVQAQLTRGLQETDIRGEEPAHGNVIPYSAEMWVLWIRQKADSMAAEYLIKHT